MISLGILSNLAFDKKLASSASGQGQGNCDFLSALVRLNAEHITDSILGYLSFRDLSRLAEVSRFHRFYVERFLSKYAPKGSHQNTN